MSKTVTVEHAKGSLNFPLKVTTAYNPDFVKLARSLKGQWSAQHRCWYFGYVTARLYDGLVAIYGEGNIDWCGSAERESAR